MNVLQEFNDTDYHPDYGMPWAPWFGFSYVRPLWGYYAPFTFGRWDMYVPAGKYNPVSEYVYGNNLVSRSDYDEKYAWSGRFTGTEYYTTDILGSVMLTTDSLSRVSNRYNYDAYGTNYTGSFSGKNKIGYNSKHYDTGTGWYNYGYRDYNPKLARFTTKDPIRDGSNWFAYCNGDPVNFVDLLGLEAVDKLAEVSNGVATPVGETWNDAQNVTSTWGNRKSFDTGNGVTADGHNGMDYGAKKGTRINAIKDGTVTKVEKNPDNSRGYGLYVEITHNDGTHSLYGHQSKINVREGQKVQAGQKIGEVGSTGKSTGPHLHLGYDGNKDGKYESTNSADNPAVLLYAGGD